ncbi:HAD-IA family hydrolase [Jannaschia seohaensis]|uniref:Phosphoglycolate phosphatase n=1 Tax=Jannaschia seohaensis TaxID=475081 RepID=A0A2Y9AQW9_9RHOB|nr:HAD-IA family hydrolase [Jannaschia seohaensis]PWJ18269.1 phosphoglycolate phosphatase [Jannaschia seohaensis]SSA46794.1 phosphoglycolate phosphatase [Jannaschia seohaensis]
MRDALAIFDVDGTLIDSGGIVVDTLTAAFEEAGASPPAPDAIRRGIGLSLSQMIATLADDLPESVFAEIVAGYRLRFAAAMEQGGEPPLYPGVEAGLARLAQAGLPLGIATGKSQRGLDRLIEAKGWQAMFASLQCADHHPSKPHPSMIRRALLETATEDGRAVMIGDSIYDMEMARAAEVHAIGVAWGYHSAEALSRAGAQTVFDDFDGLVDHLLERFA